MVDSRLKLSEETKIFVLCPSNFATGGPESLHELVDQLRNLGHDAYGFTTATFDMIRHYRPTVNVVQRPTQKKGQGYYFIGFHEIMIPLLYAALKSSEI